MKGPRQIFNIILLVLMLLFIQNAIAIKNLKSEIMELKLKISALEYKNFELSEQIKKIKFRSAFWSAE